MTARTGKWAIALVFALAGCAGPAGATPLADCSAASSSSACLEGRLREANRQLNAALKAAQEKLEQLQAQGRRPVLGAFIDSQRKFNAYRDAQCNWQGVRAPAGAKAADYVKDCQIRATEAREQELAAFLSEGDNAGATEPASAAPVQPSTPPESSEPAPDGADAANRQSYQPPEQAPAQQATEPEPAKESALSAERGHAWRLVRWVVNGVERPRLPDSNVTILFDPSGKVSGNATVNRYSGTYRFDVDGRLRWPASGFKLTRDAAAPALLAQERAFLAALRRTSLYRTDGEQLTLQSANASVVLTFNR